MPALHTHSTRLAAHWADTCPGTSDKTRIPGHLGPAAAVVMVVAPAPHSLLQWAAHCSRSLTQRHHHDACTGLYQGPVNMHTTPLAVPAAHSTGSPLSNNTHTHVYTHLHLYRAAHEAP